MFIQAILRVADLAIGVAAFLCGARVFSVVMGAATYKICGEKSPDDTTAVRWWGWPAAILAAVAAGYIVCLIGFFITGR